MNSLAGWLLGGWLLTFGAGVSTGMLLRSTGDATGEATYLEKLDAAYDLSPEQERSVRKLLDEERERIDAVLSKVDGQVKDDVQRLRVETQAKIRAALDPKQQERFDRDQAGN